MPPYNMCQLIGVFERCEVREEKKRGLTVVYHRREEDAETLEGHVNDHEAYRARYRLAAVDVSCLNYDC